MISGVKKAVPVYSSREESIHVYSVPYVRLYLIPFPLFFWDDRSIKDYWRYPRYAGRDIFLIMRVIWYFTLWIFDSANITQEHGFKGSASIASQHSSLPISVVATSRLKSLEHTSNDFQNFQKTYKETHENSRRCPPRIEHVKTRWNCGFM